MWGTTPVKYLYQGSTLVWPLTPPLPPGPDIRLNWISNGTARTQPNVYFDTGFTYGEGTSVEIKYSYHSKINDTALFGIYNFNYDVTSGSVRGYLSYEYAFMLRGIVFSYGYISRSYKTVFHNARTGFYDGNGLTNLYRGAVVTTDPALDTPHVFRTAGSSLVFDSSTYSYEGSSSGRGNVPDGSMYIFAARDTDTGNAAKFAPANTKIYYVKIYGGSGVSNAAMLYRYLVPVLHYNQVKRKYVPCFYDKISNTYFYNKGTDPVAYEIAEDNDIHLNYIERDTTGYLQYMTGVTVKSNLSTNIGFTVGTPTTPMSSLNQGVVVGARYDVSNKYGLFFPFYDSSTQYATVAYKPSNALIQTYDYNVHIQENHHADNMAFNITKGTSKTNIYTIWMEFEDGVLPGIGTTQAKTVTGSYTTTTYPVEGCEIGLFGDATMHAQRTTRIYYYDVTVNSIAACSYIPVLHNNQACFYDIGRNVYIYNQGTATPAYAQLE